MSDELAAKRRRTIKEMADSPSHKQIAQPTLKLRGFSDMKMRFKELMRGYCHQLRDGCGVASCTTVICKSNASFETLDAAGIFAKAKELTLDGFRKDKPVYHFCPHLGVDTNILQQDRILTVDDLQSRLQEADARISSIRGCFGNPEALSNSFSKGTCTPTDSGVDLVALRQAYSVLGQSGDTKAALLSAITELASALEKSKGELDTSGMRAFLIVFEYPEIEDGEHHRSVLAKVFAALVACGPSLRDVLITWWAGLDRDRLHRLVVQVVQTFLTMQLMMAERMEPIFCNATVVLGMLHTANHRAITLAAEAAELDPLHHRMRDAATSEGLIDNKEFYNYAVNNDVDLGADYRRWRQQQGGRKSPEDVNGFSFAAFPFILDPSSKSNLLKVDARVQQQQEMRSTFMQMLLRHGGPEDFYCLLRVDRSDLIRSALREVTLRLEDLKKPLKVQFLGEEGIDEGGVQKEFFQLVVKELFDPQYGMFTYNEETKCHWFNGNSFEAMEEFRLIGVVFGLAIYNSVILETRFPLPVYKKLLGHGLTVRDLAYYDVELYKGLETLLAFEESEGATVEEVYDRTFTYENEAFGVQTLVPLVPGGDAVRLTAANRREYVERFARHVLEGAVRRQFDAFASGFHAVCGGDILALFSPEELELLINGSPVLDFEELERGCRYDGYSKDDAVVKHFWEVVHTELTGEEKKMLLKFATGTDRVPIRGLGALSFVIARNGDDSEMLPTSHTCFNHLLLPPYATKDKLRLKLLTAIRNCTGFGLK